MMSVRIGFLIGVCVMTLGAAAEAQPPTGGGTSAAKPLSSYSPADLDKLAVEVLKDIHNRGADLYNRGDAAGCFRMYEGALVTVRPFLAHRPTTVKLIDDGLVEVGRTEGVKIQAFRLHEVIEQVRSELKVPLPAPKVEPKPEPKPMPMVEPKPVPAPMPKVEVKPEPKPMPKEPTPAPKPEVKPEPKPMPKEPAPAPKPVTPPAPVPAPPAPKADTPKGGNVSGKVTFTGKALADAEVTFVSLDQPKPKIFTVTTGKDGTYAFTENLPKGKYAITVIAKDPKFPAKYGTTDTSGLRIEIPEKGVAYDLDLK